MQKHQFLGGFDHNARVLHVFHSDAAELPINCAELIGQPLGTHAATETDARSVRAAFAECLFTGLPQECVMAAKTGGKYRFRFEKVTHRTHETLRPDDEVVVLGLVSAVPEINVDMTGREREVLKLLCQDLSNAEIARQLRIAESTVETHRQNIRQKVGARGIAGVVAYAFRYELVDLD